eukprot:scaffold672_cov126-Cylindrotheca_fusiformis.AAC.35
MERPGATRAAMDSPSIPSIDNSQATFSQGTVSASGVQRMMLWSDFSSDAQNPTNSLLNYMTSSYLSSQKTNTDPVSQVNQYFEVENNEFSHNTGAGPDDSVNKFYQAALPHWGHENPMLSSHLFDQSSQQHKTAKTRVSMPDQLVPNGSLDLELQAGVLALEDARNGSCLLSNNIADIGFDQIAAPTMTKRREGFQGQAKRRKKSATSPKFRPFHEQKWAEMFNQLLQFKEKRGHCLVPHDFVENQTLSSWVKRQRYQYKLKQQGKTSTMTDARILTLEEVGFVWDSHAANWQERLAELKDYVEENGHCHVPYNYHKSPRLGTWVKRQRRQGKLFWNGKTSNLNLERATALNKLGFEWGVPLLTM